MQNYKLILEYDGTLYAGLQKQTATSNTVYSVIEEAAVKVLKDDLHELNFCGRTDAGVHAKGQVFNIKTHHIFKPGKLALAINYHIKRSDIAVFSSKQVHLDFHARYSCISRVYNYKILNRSVKSPILRNRAWFMPHKLNIADIISASKILEGTHNFSYFQSIGCTAKSPIRSITEIKILQDKDMIDIQITAPSFLYRMVRNIVGVLIETGRGNIPVEDIHLMLQNKYNKTIQTSPAHGLYFLEAKYPDGLDLMGQYCK